MTPTAAVAWWILVASFGSGPDVPRALGPYPSAEMCRLAARHAMPSAQQFWTEKEISDWKAEQAREQKARDAKIDSARAKAQGKGFSVDLGCETYHEPSASAQKNGGMSYIWSCINAVSEPSPITGCVKITK